ncbi:MAG TPA: sensor domain-containing diguanylate cyclase [Capsulimonadaceae bacterium]|nr:sensor domain-containing diguanylate cyclase [Capsulimonadaceae bacterium]
MKLPILEGYDKKLHRFAEIFCQIGQADGCTIFWQEGELYLRSHGACGINSAHLRHSCALIPSTLVGRVVAKGKPLAASDISGELQLASSPDPWIPLGSTLLLPLKLTGRIAGVVALYTETAQTFQRLSSAEQDRLSLDAKLLAASVDEVRLHAKTEVAAAVDELTGLPNRYRGREVLLAELNKGLRRLESPGLIRDGQKENKFCLALMDLDGFKAINDRLGHDEGDRVLNDIAALLQMNIRKSDTVTRWYSGDEFFFVLPDTDLAAAQPLTRKLSEIIRHYVQGQRAENPSFPSIGASFGIAVFPDDGADEEALVKCMDRQMYRVKDDHHRQVHFAKPQLTLELT